MTYQNPFQYYDDTANADESSSLFLTATDASPSSVLRQEEAVAMKKKLLTALAVGVATGILLLVVAGDYSVVVAPAAAAAANGGSTETIVELPVGGDKFGTCYTPRARFRDGLATTHTAPIVTDVLIISDILKQRTEPSKRASDSVARTGVAVGLNPVMFMLMIG